MRISDWSSDVCSSDLRLDAQALGFLFFLALAFGGFLDATLVLFGQALLLGQVAHPRFLELAQDLGALVVTRSRGLCGRGVGVGLARLDQGELLAHDDVDSGAGLAADDGDFTLAAPDDRDLVRYDRGHGAIDGISAGAG